MELGLHIADFTWSGGAPEAGHKLDVLRQHCEDVGRDYEQVEKTTMIIIDPATTSDDIVRTASGLRDLGPAGPRVHRGLHRRERHHRAGHGHRPVGRGATRTRLS
jgi:hypothetical protein